MGVFPRSAARPEPILLVADDDRDTRELYRACFDTGGYRTCEAGTGSQAIVAAIELVPDVLLTDYVLPDVDGVTIARRLKADCRTAGIRILMVTGYGSPSLDRVAAEAGIHRVLLKPCVPHTVMREVARALARPPLLPVAVAQQPLERQDSVTRLRAEFARLPGLTLTAEQARLVFELGRDAAESILHDLVAEGFLRRTPGGSFKRPPAPDRRWGH